PLRPRSEDSHLGRVDCVVLHLPLYGDDLFDPLAVAVKALADFDHLGRVRVRHCRNCRRMALQRGMTTGNHLEKPVEQVANLFYRFLQIDNKRSEAGCYACPEAAASAYRMIYVPITGENTDEVENHSFVILLSVRIDCWRAGANRGACIAAAI